MLELQAAATVATVLGSPSRGTGGGKTALGLAPLAGAATTITKSVGVTGFFEGNDCRFRNCEECNASRCRNWGKGWQCRSERADSRFPNCGEGNDCRLGGGEACVPRGILGGMPGGRVSSGCPCGDGAIAKSGPLARFGRCCAAAAAMLHTLLAATSTVARTDDEASPMLTLPAAAPMRCLRTCGINDGCGGGLGGDPT